MEYKFVEISEDEFKKTDVLCVKDLAFKSYLDVLGYEVFDIRIEEGYKGRLIWFVYDIPKSQLESLLKKYENSESKMFYSYLATNRSTIHHIAKKY